MAKAMKGIAVCTVLACLVLAALYQHFHMDIFFTLAISCGTTAYHFCMRLLVGYLLPLLAPGPYDPERAGFRPLPFEKKLYKRLRVQAWKSKLPTYAPENFSLQKHSLPEILQEMCRAELVHKAIILLSFLPLLAVGQFGSFWVFLITSLLAAGFDLLFVILQRYNRPRLLKLIKQKGALFPEKNKEKLPLSRA